MNKQICVIGAGRWGKNHIKTLHELGCLAGVVDANPATLEWMREAYPDAHRFVTLNEALTCNFDAFTVATPAETHFEIAKQILQSGKHVLVEKPIALESRQAVELKKIAEERRCKLMVGHVMLFHPAIRKMKELVTNNKIGKLQYLYSNRLNLGTVRTEENILWSFAPHDISIFQYLIGSEPKEVVSRGGAFIQPHIHDSTMTILSYPNNITGHIFVSWLHPFKEHRIVVIGSKGMLSFEDSSKEKHILYYEKGVDWVKGEPVSRDGSTEVIQYDEEMPLTAEIKYFISRLDEGEVEIANAESAVQVLRVLEEASTSLLGGGTTQNSNGAAANTPYYVHPSAFVDDNVEIGEGSKIWHFSHVHSKAKIGRNCSLGQNVNVGNNVRIGNNVKIQNNVSVYEGVELEDYVFCGPSMVFTNILLPRCKYPQRGSQFYLKTLVREGASIGANATIVCGNTIGRHALIAAGAVVTSDVPDYAMMVGVPARQKGWVCECGQSLGNVTKKAACAKCGRGYLLEKGELKPAESKSSARGADSQNSARAE